MGGIIELAPGYLPAVYSTIKKAGGLCIADEVQSGFARTGSHFWGFESHGVVPDIVTMAKVNFFLFFRTYLQILRKPFWQISQEIVRVIHPVINALRS